MRIARFLLAAVIALYALPAWALDFPALTGRVVDQAGVMSAESIADVAAKSKDLEEKSGAQLAVATVSSLQGSDIETYANELFRYWKLGQSDKNNGVLLLVAPSEHKVRIEVGYGLEGTLTDALSSTIISGAIIPRFKDNDFSTGIDRGVDGIIAVLSGDTIDWQPQQIVGTSANPSIFAIIMLIFFAVLLTYLAFAAIRDTFFPKGHYVKRKGHMVFVPASGYSSGSSSDRSSSDSASSSSDDFSGGGGSSGGGGASGSW
jgi:uncharacterized protein